MRNNNLHPPITPGEILREDFMDPVGLSINQIARNIGVPPNRISEIVNGKRAISADTALRLQRYFGVEAQFWLNLQSEFDLRIAKQQKWLDIERHITPIAQKVIDPLEKATPV
jgi:antitoxin HigA-1